MDNLNQGTPTNQRYARLRRTVHHHVFNTTPPVLSCFAIILLSVALTGVGPANRKTGTFMIVKAGPGSTATPDQAEAEVILGLIGASSHRRNRTAADPSAEPGSCFQSSRDASLQCSKAGFFAPFNSTLDLAKGLINRDVKPNLFLSAVSVPDYIPDAPFLVLTWLLLSFLPIPFFVAATMPIHFPKTFAAGRLRSKPFFTISLVLLCVAWIIGFTATMSSNSEVRRPVSQRSGFRGADLRAGSQVNTFVDFYNTISIPRPIPLNHAVRGDIFVYFGFALFFQCLFGLANLVNREIAPTAEKDAFAEAWGIHAGTARRPFGTV